MRIGSGDNLALLLIHRHRFDEGRFDLPPAPVVIDEGTVVVNNNTQVIAAGEDEPACSHPCESTNSTVEADVPRPGGYGYPELPMNDAAAASSVGGGGGAFGDGGVGNLLDVFA